MAGLDSFMPGGAGRDSAELLGAVVRNRRRRTETDEWLWGAARTYLLVILMAFTLIWALAVTGSAVGALTGSGSADADVLAGLSLLVGAWSPTAGTAALLARRPHQWPLAAGAIVLTVLAMLSASALQG